MQLISLLGQTTSTDANTGAGVHGIIAWLVVGIVAGFLASKIVNKSGDGILLDLVLGIVGSFVGGFLFSLIGIGGGGLIWSILVATVGAVIVLVIYHKVIRAERTSA